MAIFSGRVNYDSFFFLNLKRWPWIQAHLWAGQPPPPHQCIPRWRIEQRFHLSWLNLPQTEVLGEECRSRTKRNHHVGAPWVSHDQAIHPFHAASTQSSGLMTWPYCSGVGDPESSSLFPVGNLPLKKPEMRAHSHCSSEHCKVSRGLGMWFSGRALA